MELKDKNVLVAYFSRADENYAVGRITKGNTQIIAEMIAETAGAETFRIETVTPYPADYDECIAVARREKQAGARPAIKGDAAVEKYDVVFIGMPNWWGEIPMALYTFIEQHDWNGKTVVPFATHEGSGMGGMDRSIARACKGATILGGLAVQGNIAQNQQDKTRKSVEKWLGELKSAL